jgi:hypothetical protein
MSYDLKLNLLDKNIGDVVFMYDGMLHKIISDPTIFKSDRLATETEIETFNKQYNENY